MSKVTVSTRQASRIAVGVLAIGLAIGLSISATMANNWDQSVVETTEAAGKPRPTYKQTKPSPTKARVTPTPKKGLSSSVGKARPTPTKVKPTPTPKKKSFPTPTAKRVAR